MKSARLAVLALAVGAGLPSTAAAVDAVTLKFLTAWNKRSAPHVRKLREIARKAGLAE